LTHLNNLKKERSDQKRLKMGNKGLHILVILLLIALPWGKASAQEERKFVRKGIELLEKESFAEAEAAFRKALELEPKSFEAGYNLATALFRQEKYEEAIRQLQTTEPRTDNDKQRLASLYHNMGNSFLYGGNIDGGIEAYKQSLRNNPLDDETRYNLIAAMKMKQQQEEQQEQQQQQEEQEQEEQQEQQQQEQQEQQEYEGISRENAERLLEALEQNEKDMMDKMKKHQQAQPVRTDKNW
jgi:Ca-activated chloride channel family protein